MSALAIVMCFFFRAHLALLNRLADGDQELGITLQPGEGEESRGVSKSFRYML